MKFSETNRPFLNPVTYLLPLILTAAWYGGMLLCPLTGDTLQGSGSFDADSHISSILFLMVSAASIFGYLCFSYKFPSLLFRIIVGLLWAPVTCLIYTLVLLEIDIGSGLVSDLFTGNSIGEVKAAFSSLVSWALLVPIYFVLSTWFALIILIPTTIYCCDRLSDHFGLTAYRKREKIALHC